MNDDITQLRQRCDQLHTLMQHAEADGVALHLALREAIDHLKRLQWPDAATMQRWQAALTAFGGSPLLLERAAAGALADAAAAWFVAGEAAAADAAEGRQQALVYAARRLTSTLMAYYRTRAHTPPVQSEPAVLAELDLARQMTGKLLARLGKTGICPVCERTMDPYVGVFRHADGCVLAACETLRAKRATEAADNAAEAAALLGRLTPRERQVAELLIDGLTNAEIGKRLCIGSGTVKVHVEHLIAKLGVANRTQAAAIAAAASALDDPLRAADRALIKEEMDRLFGEQGGGE